MIISPPQVEEYTLTIRATPSETIFLNAAIRHYLETSYLLPPEYRIASQVLRNFQNRVVESLPSRSEEHGRVHSSFDAEVYGIKIANHSGIWGRKREASYTGSRG